MVYNQNQRLKNKNERLKLDIIMEGKLDMSMRGVVILERLTKGCNNEWDSRLGLQFQPDRSVCLSMKLDQLESHVYLSLTDPSAGGDV